MYKNIFNYKNILKYKNKSILKLKIQSVNNLLVLIQPKVTHTRTTKEKTKTNCWFAATRLSNHNIFRKASIFKAIQRSQSHPATFHLPPKFT